MSIRRRLAFLICPDLRDEVVALQSGNTKCVLENERLHDQMEAFYAPIGKPDYLREDELATLAQS